MIKSRLTHSLQRLYLLLPLTHVFFKDLALLAIKMHRQRRKRMRKWDVATRLIVDLHLDVYIPPFLKKYIFLAEPFTWHDVTEIFFTSATVTSFCTFISGLFNSEKEMF